LLNHENIICRAILDEREKQNVTELVSSLGNHHSIISCDVTSNEDLECLFTKLKEKYGVIHGLVHSIAYAKAEDIQNGLINTTKDGFALALDISAYSLVTVSNKVMNLMIKGGSIVALTFMGSEKVIPGYSVMGAAKASLEAGVRYLASDMGHQGIRVNAISAGPIKTFSAKGVKNFNNVLDAATKKAPLKRRTDHEDKPEDTIIVKSPVGMLGRAINNEFIKEVLAGNKKPFKCAYHCITTCDYQNSPYCIAMALMNAQKGNLRHGLEFAGSNVYRCKEIVSVKELIVNLIKEYEEAAKATGE
jgi:enoyl-[acyl-carrier protein] reductase I